MAKNRTVFKEIPCTPYTVELWVLITDSPSFECARLNQRHKGLNLKWPEGAAAWTEDVIYNNYALAVVFDGREKYEVDTITHEVIHVKNIIMNFAGIKHDYSNDEAEAYLSGWIAGEIHKAWMEYKRL
jgi:hypothetical protein